MPSLHDSVPALASQLAHYLLIQERTKLGLKKSDVVHQIMQGHHSESRSAASKLFKDVLDEADRILDNTIGYRIREVPGKGILILVNSLNFEGVDQFLEKDERWEEIRGLLCVILSAILMSGGEAPEDDLWEFLAQLNVAKDDKNHVNFGDVEKLVKTTLVKYHYLDYCKEKHAPSFFRWGIRAEDEFNKMEMLKFVASIYGNGRTARDFAEVFTRLESEEEQYNQTAESLPESTQLNV